MRDDPPAQTDRVTCSGPLLAVLAGALWGVMPVYFRAVSDVPNSEVVLHRIVWCALLLWVVTIASGRGAMVSPVLRSPRAVATLGVTGLLLTLQWVIYLYAVTSGQLIQSSFGYFLAPLVNVALGVVLLHDTLRPGQWLAVAVAAAGTLNFARSAGGATWIGLTIGLSFGLYAVVRKRLAVSAWVGLLIETTLLLPAAFAALAVLKATGRLHFGVALRPSLLLMSSGGVTAAPLLAYVGASRRMPLNKLGFIQYLSPSLQFLLATLAYGEPVSRPTLVSFAFIWVAGLIYSFDSVRAALSRRKSQT